MFANVMLGGKVSYVNFLFALILVEMDIASRQINVNVGQVSKLLTLQILVV